MAEENMRLTEAKTAMLLHVPFFASLLLDIMTIRVTKDSTLWDELGVKPTAATDGKNLWFYDEFLTSLDIKEAVFVLCHEIGHAMWQHMARAKRYEDLGFEGDEFQPMVWNIAGDFVINDMLVQSGIGQMPKIGLHAPGKYTADMMIDDVYRDLMKNAIKVPTPNKAGKGDGGGGGQGKQPGQGGGQGKQPPQGQGGGQAQGNGPGDLSGATLDVHINGVEKIPENEMKRAIATAAEAAKAMGKMPAGLERFVDQLLKPRVQWQERLRHHITRAATREATTWTSPHRRRLVTQKIYLPSYTGKGAGTVVVVFDTSGSIGQRELTIFLSELADILDTCRPECVWLLSCDAQIYEDAIHQLEAAHDLVNYPPKIVGGGGTSFIPPFDWVIENDIDPACLIYLTDMLGTFPEEPPFPTIWCATMSNKEGPFGETIFIDIDTEA